MKTQKNNSQTSSFFYDFSQHFAFYKHTMRDRVMKICFKNIIILGVASYSDFVMICANHFTSAMSVFKIRLLRPLTKLLGVGYR